jgi:hypothetical protein
VRRTRAAALLFCVAALPPYWLACNVAPEAAPDVALEQQLGALGYVAWAPVSPHDAQRAGVVRQDPALAQPGLNLFSSRAIPGARLVDLDGGLVHEWHGTGGPGQAWNHVELTPGGDLLVVTQIPSLARLDRASNVLWQQPLRVHHDLAITHDEQIVALERVTTQFELAGRGVPALGENLLWLTPDGEVVSRIALHDLLRERVSAEQLATAVATTPDPRSVWQRARDLWRPPPADVFHANSVEILPRAVPGLGPAGAALVSLRNLDLVVVVDPAMPAIVWSLEPGVVERQHQVSLLANDHLLIFDNGRERHYSRALELDPVSQTIVWEYSGSPPRSLRSRSQGGAEALANGNVLVVESERGRAVEVTRAGVIAWEYLHPRVDSQRGARASIYRMTRIAGPW